MILASVYDKKTGLILRVLTLLDEGELALNIAEGEAALMGSADQASQIVVEGVLVAKPPDMNAAWSLFRAERDRRLAASDWTQLPDATVDREVWAAYRTALRALPENTTDPLSPDWPVAPDHCSTKGD